MKIVAITMARNEEDILEPFVRHHAAVLDLIVVIDHASLDRTPEILRELAGEGLPLLSRRETSGVQHQWQLMTAGMREASREHGADWILALDVDEFLVPAERSELEAALASIPRESPAQISQRAYIPTPEDDPAVLNPLERITHRRHTEPTAWWKVVVPGSFAADERYSLTQGNHALRNSGEPLAASPLEGFSLAHFPLRSPDQAARKILAGWLSHLARADRQPDQAFQWRRLFNELAEGKRLSPSELERAALAYSLRDPADDPSPVLVADPVPVSYEVPYTQSLTRTPIEILARTAEALVEELGSANGSEAPK
jgi:Glycosyl transferase family 2